MNEKQYLESIAPYLSGEPESCSYCDKIKHLIIYHGDYFYITVAIGSYMPGYIQLCSYMHRTSVAGILPTEYREYEVLTKAIRISFSKVYGIPGIAFEHGQAGTCLWTSNYVTDLCHHMHVHYLPVEIDIHNEISNRFPDYYEVHCIADMVKIRQDVLCSNQYLFFSPHPNSGYMYNVTGMDVPRQFLRRCVAEKLDMIGKADWQSYPGVEFYEQTINELRDVIRETVEEVKNVKK